MNGAIAKLFGFVVLLFALLVVFTSRWTVFQANALDNNALNKRTFLLDLTIKRGQILADNGEVLAESIPAGGGTWKRTYPTGSLFAQAVGYSIPAEGESAGLERSWASALEGSPTSLATIFGTINTTNQVGNDVHTTLDPKAQQVAVDQLAGRTGAVVALDPRTGAVKVLYANPTYDDNDPSELAPGQSTFDDALQGLRAPGSTFKVVTAAAALDTGQYTPDSIINGKSPIIVSGVPLENDAGFSWGPITLTKALTYSVNTVFAQVGETLGINTLASYMERFGFYAKPPLDFPADEMSASGEAIPTRRGLQLLAPTSGLIDVGRMAIGQDKLVATPMQMAMVASAVADDGVLIAPHFVTKVVNPDGQIEQSIAPAAHSVVMKPSAAQDLAQMMTDVVEEGTGQAANLDGIQVAGKTGTAQVTPGIDDPWFIGFAPVSHPQVAVAVWLQDIPNGYGGTYAAPIAAQVIKTLLAEGQ